MSQLEQGLSMSDVENEMAVALAEAANRRIEVVECVALHAVCDFRRDGRHGKLFHDH